MRLATLLFLLSVLAAPAARAQLTGDCARGTASAVLEGDDVRAALYDTGGFYRRDGDALYEVPRGSGVNAVSVASLWIGGQVDGTLHFAGGADETWELWPGPVPPDGAAPSAADCAAYDHLQGRWLDGRSVEYGGDGLSGTNGMPAAWMYPSPPPDYWSEGTPGTGVPHEPGERRMVLSNGPFTLQPGQTATFTWAVLWAPGEHDRYGAVYRLRLDASLVRGAPLEPDPRLRTITPGELPAPVEPEPPPPEVPERLLLSVSPSPFDGPTTAHYALPEAAAVRLTLYDLLGRQLAVLVDAEQEAGPHEVALDGARLAAGAYVLRLAVSGQATRSRVVVRAR